MDTIEFDKAHANLNAIMDRACAQGPVIISGDRDAVVMLSLADYHSLQESITLANTPLNA